jgi:hypothetical protein
MDELVLDVVRISMAAQSVAPILREGEASFNMKRTRWLEESAGM